MPYVVQGKPVSLDTEPFLQGDKHYVSLREVVGALDGSVTFDNDTKVSTATIAPWTADVTNDDTSVPMTSTANQSATVTLTAAPFIDNDEMYVPYDFLRDAFGYKVDFDEDTTTVTITNPNIPAG